jgi:hypothetical protein
MSLSERAAAVNGATNNAAPNARAAWMRPEMQDVQPTLP